MKFRISILIAFIFVYLIYPQSIIAHTGQGKTVGNYKVEITQEPLSPFVGEEVRVNFIVNDTNGKPVTGLKGELILKETIEDQFVGKDSVQSEKEISRNSETTDEEGTINFKNTFDKESVYDVEFVWGENLDTESSGIQIFVREPTSFFAAEEIQKRIWLFILISFVGMVAGSIMTFIFLTTTLHPKK